MVLNRTYINEFYAIVIVWLNFLFVEKVLEYTLSIV